MSDYMGAKELPLGEAAPVFTPPEGVIVSRIEGDGWTRKYFYRANPSMGDRSESFLVEEVPPPMAPIRREVPIHVTPSVVVPGYESSQPVPQVAPPPSAPAPQLGVSQVPGMAGAMRVPGRAVSSPFAGVANAQATLPSRPMLAGPGSSLSIVSSTPPPRSLRLAQSSDQQTSVPPAPCPVPPGPMQLPNGKIVQLTDNITLEELWTILPYMTQQCIGQAEKQLKPPPQAQPGIIPTSPIGAGFPGFGPASGAFGQGGFQGGGGGGLTGPLGVVVGTPQPSQFSGPPGPQGPQGPVGPPGAGSAVDFLTKTDGDFTAGPGAFIPVPETLISFNQGSTGSAIFIINAAFGCAQTNNNALAIMVDGTIIPLQVNLIHTVAGEEGFFQPVTAMWPMLLAAGAHTVQVMLRGIGAGEFCAGSGLGLSATIAAEPSMPLSIAVIHQGPGLPPVSAALLVVDGVSKTDVNFTATGVLTAVPGMSVNFMVTTPGNAQVVISADFVGNPFSNFPQLDFGLIVDGGPPIQLCTWAEEQGAGSDKVFNIHLTGMIVIPFSIGPHSVQAAYESGTIGPPMSLVAAPNNPATVSVIHP